MDNLQGFRFISLQFDKEGNPQQSASTNELIQAASQATDLIFIAHGFRNDEGEARQLYSDFLKNFRSSLQRPEMASLGSRRFVVAGVFWPSKAFKEMDTGGAGGNIQSTEDEDVREAERLQVKATLEELRDTEASEEQRRKLDKALSLLDQIEDDPAAQDDFVRNVMSLLDDVSLEETEGLSKVQSKEGSRLLELLADPIVLPVEDSGGSNPATFDADLGETGTGEVQGITDFVSSIFGQAGRLLNVTSWYLMKDRSGKVGANGLAQVVRAVSQAQPAVKIHLVGHSLGGRCVAACAKALDQGSVASLTLLQAAFSHYGFSSSPGGHQGFFQEILRKKVVRGPIFATFSKKDQVVGIAYAIASRLAQDNTKAVGDENDEYGGIGRNGSQRLSSASREHLREPGHSYNFQGGKVHNLDGSPGLIKDHGDVKNPAVTYAFSASIAKT